MPRRLLLGMLIGIWIGGCAKGTPTHTAATGDADEVTSRLRRRLDELSKNMRDLATASEPEHFSFATKFAWPVPSSALVTTRITVFGVDATIRFRIEVSRGLRQKLLRIDFGDIEVVKVVPSDPSYSKLAELFREVLELEQIQPLFVTTDGEFFEWEASKFDEKRRREAVKRYLGPTFSESAVQEWVWSVVSSPRKKADAALGRRDLWDAWAGAWKMDSWPQPGFKFGTDDEELGHCVFGHHPRGESGGAFFSAVCVPQATPEDWKNTDIAFSKALKRNLTADQYKVYESHPKSGTVASVLEVLTDPETLQPLYVGMLAEEVFQRGPFSHTSRSTAELRFRWDPRD